MRAGILWSCIVLQGFAAEPTGNAIGPGGEATAQPNHSAATESVDYSQAFEHLINLGLPDARGATYVTLALHGDADREGQYNGYSGRGGAIETKGNAWLLPKPKDGASTLIYRGYDKVTVVKAAKRGKVMRALLGPEKKTAPGEIRGDWKIQDVAPDVKKILGFLNAPPGEEQLFSAERWGYDDSPVRSSASVLVTACHLYRAGHQDDANKITQRLFEIAPEPILIIDQVVNDLAERQYQSLVRSFFATKDWKAYQQGIRQLVTRFSRGWRNREGAELLLTRVEKRVKAEKTALSPLKGVNLKPQTTKILDDWLVREKPILVTPPLCWLLGADLLPKDVEDEYSYRSSREEPPDEPWLTEICGMGMDGFIAMTAAATDDSLIPTSMRRSYMNDYYQARMFQNYSGISNDASPGELQYATMTRPCSRGEIARAMILRTLPDQDGEFANLTPAELQATAYQWWLEHRSASPSELSRHFLEFGSDQQQLLAVMALIKSNDDADAKVVESHILEAEDLSDKIRTVELYLKARRGKARPFFEAYSKAIKEQLANLEVGDRGFQGNWEIQQAGGVNKYLKTLSVHVHEVPPEKILADLRSGELAPTEGLPMLEVAMGAGALGNHLPELVALARQQENQGAQFAFLRSVTELAYKNQRHYAAKAKGELDAYQASLPALLSRSKEDWTYFLNQNTPLEDAESSAGAPSLAAAAAWAMEAIYFPQHTRTLHELNNIMGSERHWAFMKEQALRVLLKGADTAFPDSGNVGEAQRQAIRAKIKGMSPLEIINYYDRLGLDEKLAWGEILSGYGESPPKGLIELRKRIAKISWQSTAETDKALQERIKKMVYSKVVDQALIDDLVEMMLDEATVFQDITMAIQSEGPQMHGLTLSVVRDEQGRYWKRNILTNGYEKLRDGSAEKVIGLNVTGGDTKTGLRYVPAQAADEAGQTLQGAITVFLSLLDKETQAYAIFVVETAENLKRQEAEEEEDGELGILPP